MLFKYRFAFFRMLDCHLQLLNRRWTNPAIDLTGVWRLYHLVSCRKGRGEVLDFKGEAGTWTVIQKSRHGSKLRAVFQPVKTPGMFGMAAVWCRRCYAHHQNYVISQPSSRKISWCLLGSSNFSACSVAKVLQSEPVATLAIEKTPRTWCTWTFYSCSSHFILWWFLASYFCFVFYSVPGALMETHLHL